MYGLFVFLLYICVTAFYSMKNKIPKTKLEIELFCDKIILQQQVKRLQTHLRAALNALDLVLNEKGRK